MTESPMSPPVGSEKVAAPGPARADGITVWPTAWHGWLALALSVIGLGSWIVLPLITTLFGEQYPVTDSVVMPIIGSVLIMIAAVVDIIVLWPGKQRSVMNIVATFVVVPTALLFTTIVIGETIGGA